VLVALVLKQQLGFFRAFRVFRSPAFPIPQKIPNNYLLFLVKEIKKASQKREIEDAFPGLDQQVFFIVGACR
jgi:hypothetical protein